MNSTAPHPQPTAPAAAAAASPSRRRGAVRVGSYIELTKPGITRLVTMTAAAGFYLASPADVDWVRLLYTLVGVAVAAGGANALNEYTERELDARMRRTRGRPLPSGRVGRRGALVFALLASIAGTLYLLLLVNAATALLVALSIVSYVVVYTPLKTRTTLATLVGAVPGALPILAGWAAAGGRVGPVAWSLFLILFLWQIPHFLALAWMHRDDYARGGYAMLTVFDPDGGATGRQTLLYSLALLPVSLLPSVFGLTGALYFVGAFVLGVLFLVAGAAMSLRCTADRARRLFLASVLYLPLLLVLMVVDKV